MTDSNIDVSSEICKSINSDKESIPNRTNISSLFKSRKGKLGNSSGKNPAYRKKGIHSEKDANSDKIDHDIAADEEEIKAKELRDLLELRKLTAYKSRGLSTMRTKHNGETKDAPPQEKDVIEDKPKPKKDIMDAFTRQTKVLDVDKHMTTYIESKIKLLKQGGSEDSTNLPENQVDDLPDLKLGGKKPTTEGNLLLSTSMLTAIPEVDLGLESRLKNIEQTEIAKQALLESRKTLLTTKDFETGLPSRFMEIPSSKNDLNFSIQRPQEHRLMSDKEAVARFKKRFRHQ